MTLAFFGPVGLGYALMETLSPKPEEAFIHFNDSEDTKHSIFQRPQHIQRQIMQQQQDQIPEMVRHAASGQSMGSAERAIAEMLARNIHSNRPPWDVQPLDNNKK